MVEVKQPGEDFVVAQGFGAVVFAPAIGVGDCFIERAVSVVEPRRAGIVQVGERALLEFLRGGFVLRQDAVRIDGDDFRDMLDQIGRVEPVLAQGMSHSAEAASA